jgi:FtsP/CotA-like multicopper oxidase with cupredoxin domain
MDGSNISQAAVEPNGGQFRYEFKLLTPALYWYHPHIQTNEQIEKGLYGPLLVHGGAETALGLPEDEYVLVLDDVPRTDLPDGMRPANSPHGQRVASIRRRCR